MTDFERLSITAAALRTILHQEEAVTKLAEEKPSIAGAASAAQAARAAAVAVEALRLIGDISEASAKAQQAAIIQRARRALQLASQRTDAAASFDHLRMVN
ncbi:MAG: hypothetical protein ACK4VM_07170 [Bosea sp. (in: a-proteobacteria)]